VNISKNSGIVIQKIIPAVIQAFVGIIMLGVTALSGAVAIRELMELLTFLSEPVSQSERIATSSISFLHISNAILALEFMLLSIKYFREHFHFPLRYVIYIGVTSIIRHMVVSHEHLLTGSVAILLLVIAYCMICVKNYKIGKEKYT
jgi:protein PsiE